jgi:hypothetical protein
MNQERCSHDDEEVTLLHVLFETLRESVRKRLTEEDYVWSLCVWCMCMHMCN